MSSKVYISIGQVAKLLNVSIKTVRRWAESGKLDCSKTSGGHRRFCKEDVMRIKNSENSITIISEK